MLVASRVSQNTSIHFLPKFSRRVFVHLDKSATTNKGALVREKTMNKDLRFAQKNEKIKKIESLPTMFLEPVNVLYFGVSLNPPKEGPNSIQNKGHQRVPG